MANCTANIYKVIESTCLKAKVGGIEQKVWAIPRTWLEPTFDTTTPNLITDLQKIDTKVAYPITSTGISKLFDAGFDVVVADDRPDRWKHSFVFQQFEMNAADIDNVDAMNDMVFIYEGRDKTTDGDGVFFAVGVKSGLYKEADTKRTNTNHGSRSLTFASKGDDTETSSVYVVKKTGGYAATLAMLVALETVNP